MNFVRRASDVAAFVFVIVGVAVVPLIFWPWSDDVFVGPKFDALRLFTAGGAIAGGVWLATERPTLRFRLSDLAAFVFVILNVVAFAFSVDRGTSLLGAPLQQSGLVTVFALAGVYAVARISFRTLGRLTSLYAAAASAATVASVYGIVQIAGADPIWSALPLSRAFSTIGQPNWLAAYLVITIPLTIALTIMTPNRIVRWIGIGATLLQVIALLTTLSRSGYLGLAASLGVGAILAARQGARVAVISKRSLIAIAFGVVLGVGLLVGLSATTSSVAPSELVRRAGSTLNVRSFESRQYLALWEVGLAITADNPFTGTGQDTYAVVFPEYRDDVLTEAFAAYLARFRPESPHNVYLSVAAGTGVPALLAYLVVVGGAGIAIFRHIGARSSESILLSALIAAMVGHVVTDSFMTIDLSGSWLFWALMGAGLALIDHQTVRRTVPLFPRSFSAESTDS
jgi:putative inorganic carbon (HCO3(-)) transporter